MRRSCQGKVRHASEAAAITACRILRRKKNLPLWPYYCKECTAWHVGHSSRRERQIRKRKEPWI